MVAGRSYGEWRFRGDRDGLFSDSGEPDLKPGGIEPCERQVGEFPSE